MDFLRQCRPPKVEWTISVRLFVVVRMGFLENGNHPRRCDTFHHLQVAVSDLEEFEQYPYCVRVF